MASYSETEREMLRGTPIDRILTSFGRDTKHGTNNMYFSPFRSETTPSFHVDPQRNGWYDFGTGESGSSVTLVCMLLKCNGGKAYDYLASLSNTVLSRTEGYIHPMKPAVPAHGISVLDVKEHFADSRLLGYAESRGISPKVLDRWCSEILCSVESRPGKKFTAIGFRNDLSRACLDEGVGMKSRDFKLNIDRANDDIGRCEDPVLCRETDRPAMRMKA